MDRILVDGMQFHGRVGCSEAERKLPHAIEVDVEMYADLRAAGRSDRLEDTLDYAEVYRRAKAIVEKGEYRLLEAVAEGIADALKDLGGQRVVVRVRKPHPPFGGAAAFSEVQIER